MSKTLMKKLFMKQQLYIIKMDEGYHLQQHVNVFNNIIIDIVKFMVKIDDRDKEIISVCSLPSSYDHLVTIYYL